MTAPPTIPSASLSVAPKCSNPQMLRKSIHQEDCMKPESGLLTTNASHSFQGSVAGGRAGAASKIAPSDNAFSGLLSAVTCSNLRWKGSKISRLRSSLARIQQRHGGLCGIGSKPAHRRASGVNSQHTRVEVADGAPKLPFWLGFLTAVQAHIWASLR